MSDDLVREKVRLYATEVTPAQLPSFGGVAVRRRRRRVRQALAATSSVVVVALVVVLVALVSHTSAPRTIAPSGSLESQLVGPTWTLQQLSVGGKDVPVSSSNPWTLQLTATTYLGEDGCNSISGDVTYGMTTVNLHFGEQTAAACPGAQLQEAFRALESGSATAVTGGRTLTLTVGSRVLRLAREDLPFGNPSAGDKLQTGALQANLEGVSWALRSVSDNGKVSHLPASQHARLYLSAGNYYFDNGCSIDYGRMEYDNTRVTMTGQGGVGSLCPYSLPEFSTPSTAFTAVAEGKPVFRFTSSGITLGAGKIVLTFDRTTPVDVHTALHQAVAGHVWRLTRYSFKGKAYAVPAGARPTLELADAQYEAFDGCNSSAGYLSYVTGTLWVRPVAGNVVPCGQQWYSVTEALAGVLNGDTHASLTGTTLSMTGNGATLVFSRGPASARSVFDNLPPLPPF
jgi:heat shock protein HslJ